MLTAILQMEDKQEFLSPFGGVDDCHIQMICPRGGNTPRKKYHNLKKINSMAVMGVVEADYKFLWTSVGLSGSSSDACTFQASRLYQHIVAKYFLPKIQKVVKLVI